MLQRLRPVVSGDGAHQVARGKGDSEVFAGQQSIKDAILRKGFQGEKSLPQAVQVLVLDFVHCLEESRRVARDRVQSVAGTGHVPNLDGQWRDVEVFNQTVEFGGLQ